jgi:hypothetical protein
MIMVVHKTISMTEPMIPILDLLHYIEEYLTVPIILEDGLPCIPSGGDMVYCPRVLNPQWPRHKIYLLYPKSNVKIKDLTPMT